MGFTKADDQTFHFCVQSIFPSLRSGRVAGLAMAALLMASCFAGAQTTPATGTAAPPTDPVSTEQPAGTMTISSDTGKKSKKEDKVVESKDTKKEIRKTKKTDPLVGQDAKLPDKQLYDKSMDLMKRGHFDVARLDLQTLLNTYPDTQYQMRAKLAIADSWYREGGSAALTQAEAEYATSACSSPMLLRRLRLRCVSAIFTSGRWTSRTAITARRRTRRRSIAAC